MPFELKLAFLVLVIILLVIILVIARKLDEKDTKIREKRVSKIPNPSHTKDISSGKWECNFCGALLSTEQVLVCSRAWHSKQLKADPKPNKSAIENIVPCPYFE